MKELSRKMSSEIIKKSLLPIFIFLIFLCIYIFYKIKIQSDLPERFQIELRKYSTAIFVICIFFVIQRIAGAALGWYKENIAVKTATHLDDELIPILRRTSKIIIWIVAILIILPLFGININGLIATLGVGSLAVALAAQDTIANIIAGFLIMVDRPFRPGDKIKLPSGEVVAVLDIGVRRSKFLSEDKAIVIIPNLELSKSKIVNYTYGEERSKSGT